MLKNIFKEIIIILLLLVAIVLVLGVFLYDYIPTSKVVPTIEAYQAPESIKNELEETIQENELQTIVTYEIDQTDLTMYEKGKDYNKGKANPFDATTTAPTNTGSNNNSINNTNSNVTNNTNTSNPEATGNYIPSTGTK